MPATLKHPREFRYSFWLALREAWSRGESVLPHGVGESAKSKRTWRKFICSLQAHPEVSDGLLDFDYSVEAWEGVATGTQGLLITRKPRLKTALLSALGDTNCEG